MVNTLAGTLFVYNAKSQDYCYLEAYQSLKEFCDFVIICDAGSTDGTYEELEKLEGDGTAIIRCDPSEWHQVQGREKLNHFTNKAIEMAEFLGYDFQFNLQADEIVHEKSYDIIRKLLDEENEAYQCKRINLWGSPFTKLKVEPSRLPCSEVILRYGKTNYRSIGDAESIEAPCNTDFIDQIRIYHMGFVRDKRIHPHKIRHMQEKVFQIDSDKKLEGMAVFDPWKWFDPCDVVPIEEPLPRIIQAWAIERM